MYYWNKQLDSLETEETSQYNVVHLERRKSTGLEGIVFDQDRRAETNIFFTKANKME
jgi:hypothetical protein